METFAFEQTFKMVTSTFNNTLSWQLLKSFQTRIAQDTESNTQFNLQMSFGTTFEATIFKILTAMSKVNVPKQPGIFECSTPCWVQATCSGISDSTRKMCGEPRSCVHLWCASALSIAKIGWKQNWVGIGLPIAHETRQATDTWFAMFCNVEARA